MRRALRVVAWLAALVVAALALLFAAFVVWSGRHARELEAGSTVTTTVRGDVEYAVEGKGIPYLSLHGSPGGYDSALAGRRADPAAYENVMTIAVSRPGYLRTPLASGRTFEEQADLLAALLDRIGVTRAVVLAASGGGYDGLQFALRHPDRCLALVMLAPAFRHEPLPEGPPTPHPFLWRLQDFGIWSLTLDDRLAGLVVKDLNRQDGAQTVFFGAVMRALIPFSRRFDGARNDVVQRLDPAIDRWPVEAIAVPTLVVHGTADENSKYQDSAVLVSKIPQAELVTIPDADHFMPITHAREIQAEIRRFVRERGAK